MIAIIELIKNKIIPCPKDYGSYDQRNDDCPICGEAKLYQTDRGEKNLKINSSACAGWIHPNHGPLSCVSFAKLHLESVKEITCWACLGRNVLGEEFCAFCDGTGKMIHEPIIRLKCGKCGCLTDQQNIILTSKGNVCLSCDPNFSKDIPAMDVIGVL